MRRRGRDPGRTLATGHNGHLSMPHYQPSWRSRESPRISTCWEGREMVDGRPYAFGHPDDVVDRIVDLHRAGVDEVVMTA